MSFLNELKRRNVFKVTIAYTVAAWLLLQIVDLVLENINSPDWVMQVFMLAMAVGLPIVIIIAWAFEMTPEGIKLEKDVDRSASITRETGMHLNRGIIIILVMLVVFLLTDKFRENTPEPEVTEPARTESAPDEAVQADIEDTSKSIAVLPFVNMSSDPEQEYFADGISEELLNALAKVSGLKVAGRTSSFAFKGKNDDLNAIGKVLRVSHILEGSVRKSGTRIRITAQLIKVDDGYHMWSETYDRELNDIFIIQDEITAAILVQLKTQLLGGQQLLAIQTDPRAYDLYLLAKQRIYDRTEASMKMAVRLLEEAVSIDANYAPSFAQLGIANLFLAERNYGTVPNMQAAKIAKINLDKALQLAPQNAEALAGMGLYYMHSELDHEKAIDLLQQALAINPNLVNASAWLANELDTTGKLQASLQLREQTFQLDPLHRPTFGNLQQSYAAMGQPEKALEMLEGLQVYLPGDEDLLGDFGQVYVMTGQLAEAHEHLRPAYENEPLNAVASTWYGFALYGTRQYEQMAEVTPAFLATLALSRLGRSEEALILGNRAIGEGAGPNFYFQALVENGQFEQLIETLESRWSSLDEFSNDWPGGAGYGYGSMASIAYAYRELGNEEKFKDAIARFKVVLDAQTAEGANNWVFNFSRAQHSILTNDYEAAIDLMELAFEQGLYIDTVAETAWPILKPLNGDPRYEAAKAVMEARLNMELKKMSQDS
jgi:TolB-like protein